MRSKVLSLFAAFVLACSGHVPARAENAISAVDLFDRLRGMWMGQLIGNAAGRATEGVYDGAEPNPSAAVPWEIKQVWDGDDDTDIEYLALHILETHGFGCDGYEIAEQWLDHVSGRGIYIANKQAWSLMRDGFVPPETGSRSYNEHWYSIDAQIGTEVLGAISPGMPQAASNLAAKFGHITNAGYAVHAAQFYAVMYANAFFEPDIEALVRGGLDAIPGTSRTAAVVGDVLDWYLADAEDGPLDWRSTRRRLYEAYQGQDSSGRYINWIESPINTGATVLALLYGQGDFKQTVQIAVLAGWDCDCNPATAGGLLGIVHGFEALPDDLTDPAICGDLYMNVNRPGLPEVSQELPQYEAITEIALRMLVLAQRNIRNHGGTYGRISDTRVYRIGDPCEVVTEPEQPDPIGPGGLAGEALAAGIGVAAQASVERYDEGNDRYDLNSIADGIIDSSYNGHRPYTTYVWDPAARPYLDWYELAFSAPVQFQRVTFHEGDVVWAKINEYVADDEPLGGFFEDLTVQILQDGQYREPPELQISEALDPLQMYQAITFDFAPTVGQAVRVIGTPGGSRHFTTILELEVDGELLSVVDPNAGDGQALAP